MNDIIKRRTSIKMLAVNGLIVRSEQTKLIRVNTLDLNLCGHIFYLLFILDYLLVVMLFFSNFNFFLTLVNYFKKLVDKWWGIWYNTCVIE